MKSAGKNADYAVIIGEEEAAAGTVTLKNLRDGEQQTVPVRKALLILTGQQ